ncbi:MAG: FHA domain-containing protein [Anaerolineales bacterium]|nr:FHA domain-containing protein [Anaerolineales bacterium]
MNTTMMAVLLIVLFWGASIIFVAWDTKRRGVAGSQRSIWLLLAAVPLLGLAAYLIARAFLPAEVGAAPGAGGRSQARVTFLKRDAPKRLPTIPAADYLRAAQPAAARRGDQAQPAAGAGRMTYILRVTDGPHAGEKFVIDRFPALIGRGSDCQIRLDNDLGVSRRHAELYQQAGKVRLRDLGSTHGTTVNGSKINDKELASADKIRLGYSLLSFKVERPVR